MALGAALATGQPQTYAVVPGPGLLNTSAALLTAYAMNAPVLALIGQIPDDDIGRGLGHLHEIRDQAGIISRLVDFSARIRSPEAPRAIVAQAIRVDAQRPARARPRSNAPSTCGAAKAPTAIAAAVAHRGCRRSTKTPCSRRPSASARPSNPMIICGGGAQDARPKSRELSGMLQAPVLGYRRGRGVLDSRRPVQRHACRSGTNCGREADAVLAVGTHMSSSMRQWGIDDNLAVIRVDADPEEPARVHAPAVALDRRRRSRSCAG